MDCTIMKKPPSQTILDYSILSLAVSPELCGIIIVCTPFLLGGGLRLLLSFQKGGLDWISVFRERERERERGGGGGVTVDLLKVVPVFT